MRQCIRRWVSALGIALALALPAAAAASPRTQQYSNPIKNEQAPKSVNQSAGGVAAASTGTLPFTGAELGGIVVFGIALLGAGTLLVVRARRHG
jgi:hypothetical protein